MSLPCVRLAWLDIAKGLGIVLVVTGHVLALSPSALGQDISDRIFLFHMPLFFLLAGRTLRPESIATFAWRKAVALLLPYGVFLGLLGLPTLAATCATGQFWPSLGVDRCPVLAIKLVLGGSSLTGIFGTFWFIPCLLAGLVLAQIGLCAVQERSAAQRLAVLLMATMVATAVPLVLPASTKLMGLVVAPMAAVLIMIGYFSSRLERPLPSWASAGLLLMAATTLLCGIRLDMKLGQYGYPLISMAGALALSALLVRLARWLALRPLVSGPLQWLGRSTLTILCLHQAVHLGLRAMGMHNELVLLATALGVPLLLHAPLRRLCDWLAQLAQPHLSRKSPVA